VLEYNGSFMHLCLHVDVNVQEGHSRNEIVAMDVCDSKVCAYAAYGHAVYKRV
jgi:hypothetical protein